MTIKVTPLGAGQDVGRSCILVSLGNKNVMLDCGMHMGYDDDRRFPDFSYIAGGGPITKYIDAVIISHFHLDHCGSLPYLTEKVGYDGPIYMTAPTKAICPILLEDYRHLQVSRYGEKDFFTSENIANCMKKVRTIALHETTTVVEDLQIKVYYAGHVLGAGMFMIKTANHSIVYTGDYNMTPDRHLGAAAIDKCRPDLLITESTYATTIRDSKRVRERDFLRKVYDCVVKGGNVLIPAFALGRAQELCILLDIFWERMNLKVPIYYSTGLTAKANDYYRLFISWTSQKIKKTCVDRNMFDFKHIQPWSRSLIGSPGPMVVFATPGMLHSGMSLELFSKWAPYENNMLIMPGYCVAGTVGAKVLAGEKRVEIDGRLVDVKLSVQHLSFSAHADAKGIMQLIHNCQPKSVLLVHGECSKMAYLSGKITSHFKIACHYPANGHTVTLPRGTDVPVEISSSLVKQLATFYTKSVPLNKRLRLDDSMAAGILPRAKIPFEGVLMMQKDKLQIMMPDEAIKGLGLLEHKVSVTVRLALLDPPNDVAELLSEMLRVLNSHWPDKPQPTFHATDDSLFLHSIKIRVCGAHVAVDWDYQDEALAKGAIEVLKGNMTVF